MQYEDLSEEFIKESMELVSEELTPEQKKTVDSWYTGYSNPHEEVFGSEDRIRLPYDSSSDKPITGTGQVGSYDSHHNIVLASLLSRRYKTDDYASGVAYHRDNPQRKLRIGSLLTGEHDIPNVKRSRKGTLMSMSQVYAADPIRAAHGAEKEIVISKHKYDVAGCSTDRGWSSCMDMNGGENKHFLPRDIEHHTLAAYLVRKGEDPDKNPIGRVSLKKFANADGHKIFRPESATYGSAPPGFHAQVSGWADKHYPSKEGFYQKESSLYNDDGKNLLLEKSHTDSSKIHKDIESSVYQAARNIRNARDHHDWNKYPDAMVPDIDELHQKVESIHDQLPEKDVIHSVIHHLTKNTGEDLDDNIDIHDNNADDKALHNFAVTYAEDKFGRRKKPFHEFGPGESIEALSKMHAAGGEDWNKRYANKTQENLMDAHSDLLDHVFAKSGHSKEWDAANDIAVGHIATPSHEEYYHDMAVADYHHLARQTKNPRLIHTLLNNNESERDAAFNDHTTMEHIGRHADAKLAHEVYHHPDLSYEHGNSFLRGTNDNEHGEAIQHDLTKGMLLIGGHDGRGDDDVSSESHLNLFSGLAHKTKFKSVYDKIKARSTTDLDHPDIHAGLKLNSQFHTAVHESTEMQRYLRAFRR